jgi:G patch domain/KOW motif-containing protein
LKILAKSKKIKKDKKENKKHRLRWVQPQARVRIVSKDYRSGRFYNTKVVVQDILDKYHFSALTPKGEILDDLEEEHVETVIPELEKRVVVL